MSRKKSRERRKEIKKYFKENPKIDFLVRAKLSVLRKRSERKNLKFDLEIEDIKHFWIYPECFYCGKKVDMAALRGTENKGTVDRFNHLLGYERGNVVLACHPCNFEKSKREAASRGSMFQGGDGSLQDSCGEFDSLLLHS